MDTSFSLLEGLRQPADGDAWRRLTELYGPLIRGWLGRHGLQAADADDVQQEILTIVLLKLPEFQHNGRCGAFRSWLRMITANCLRGFWRSRNYRPFVPGDTAFGKLIDQLEDAQSPLSRLWDLEHDQFLVGRALVLLEADFQPTTWQAFRLQVLDGQPADIVAAELGLSLNAAVIAKSRVLQKLRQAVKDLIAEPD